MAKVYSIYTVEGAKVTSNVKVGKLELSGGGSIPAVLVGSKANRGNMGVVPVHLSSESYRKWQRGDQVMIAAVSIGETKSKKPKFFEENGTANMRDHFIVVMRSSYGYRGGNSHTGDRDLTAPPKTDTFGRPKNTFLPFPGEVIVRGVVKGSPNGNLGSGEQLIARMPIETVFRYSYFGRQSGHHYYKFDQKEQLLTATWDERDATECF